MDLSSEDVTALSRLMDQAEGFTAAQREALIESLPDAQRHLAGPLRAIWQRSDSPAPADLIGTRPSTAPSPPQGQAGECVGPYLLQRVLGHGGMGSVWLAERADGQYARQVALKLPRLAATPQLERQMASERRIGALLEHPAIARLYDAGTDEQGRPYIAMEYIAGIAIDRWCREHSPSVPATLRLFLPIIRAVAYAHSRLVIHRDLKPSNILVDAQGQAHLLDFGIAKLLDTASADGLPVGAVADSQLTLENGRALTPRYAAPEQIAGQALTVAADIYSLGVTLFELLTGSPPHRPRRPTAAAMEEAILEGEPSLASSRAATPERACALAGEIDAMLAKALRREPGERYASAQAFAEDIERHLAGEPVLARPDSLGRRWRRRLRKHGAAFALATVAFVAVLGGAAAALAQARRADAEARRSQAVTAFVTDIFKVNSDDAAINRDLRQLPAEKLLQRSAALIDQRFAEQPALRADMHGVVARIFSDLADPARAAEHANKQFLALQASGAEADAQVRALLLWARALQSQGRLADAEGRARSALSLAGHSPSSQAGAHLALAEILDDAARYADEKQELDVAAALLADPAVGTAIDRADLAYLRTRTGSHEYPALMAGFEQAITLATQAEGPLSRRAVSLRMKAVHRLGNYEPTVAIAKQHLAAALSAMRSSGGDKDPAAALAEAEAMARFYDARTVAFEEARSAIERARELLRKQADTSPQALARADMALGWVYRNWGDHAASRTLIAAAQPVLVAATERPFELRVLAAQAGLSLQNIGRHDEADAYLRQSLALRTRDSPESAAHGQLMVAHNLMMANRQAEAQAALDGARERLKAHGDVTFGGMAERGLIEEEALLALRRGQAAEALRLSESTMTAPLLAMETAELMELRGQALCAAGQPVAGLAWLDKAISQMAADSYPQSPELAAWRAHAGLCALSAGQRQRAEQLAQLAANAIAQAGSTSAYWSEPVLQLQRELRCTGARGCRRTRN